MANNLVHEVEISSKILDLLGALKLSNKDAINALACCLGMTMGVYPEADPQEVLEYILNVRTRMAEFKGTPQEDEGSDG